MSLSCTQSAQNSLRDLLTYHRTLTMPARRQLKVKKGIVLAVGVAPRYLLFQWCKLQCYTKDVKVWIITYVCNDKLNLTGNVKCSCTTQWVLVNVEVVSTKGNNIHLSSGN